MFTILQVQPAAGARISITGRTSSSAACFVRKASAHIDEDGAPMHLGTDRGDINCSQPHTVPDGSYCRSGESGAWVPQIYDSLIVS